MNINELLKKRNISKYKLSKLSSIPYMTLNDICNGKTELKKCSAETVYRLAQGLQISMEDLLAPYMEQRISFELFKSNVCHSLKQLGDINFLIETIQDDSIQSYYAKGWYPECFYLLAMTDYISRINDIPICEEYNDLRHKKLENIIYPASVLALAAVQESEAPKREAMEHSIAEFMRYNIVESEVRNIV